MLGAATWMLNAGHSNAGGRMLNAERSLKVKDRLIRVPTPLGAAELSAFIEALTGEVVMACTRVERREVSEHVELTLPQVNALITFA